MHGSLDQLLWGSQASIATKLKERQQLKIVEGVAAGIAFLHRNRVCHRDLKSPNCLYNRDLTVKLCDFAFSKWKQAGAEGVMSSAVGTPAWMAPEILRGGEYTFTADVYSFGVSWTPPTQPILGFNYKPPILGLNYNLLRQVSYYGKCSAVSSRLRN